MMLNFEVISAETPVIKLHHEGDEIVVSWPAPSQGWTLEASNDLEAWSVIDSELLETDSEWIWKESASNAPRFFRLKYWDT